MRTKKRKPSDYIEMETVINKAWIDTEGMMVLIPTGRGTIDKLRKDIELYSLAVFKILNMRGTARIDFLYDSNNKLLYVTEVNSIPWCYAHNLWEAKHISYKELLNIVLDDAREVEVHKQKMINNIENDIIKNLTNNKIKEMK